MLCQILRPTQGDFCYWDLQLDFFPFALAKFAVTLIESITDYSGTSFQVTLN